jgi:fatty-acyl-CoA synthase
MSGRLIAAAKAAHSYPLLIKQLLRAPMGYRPNQEIVYRDQKRLSYADLRRRIGRLASALTALGLGQPSFSGSVFRDPDDGRDPADG